MKEKVDEFERDFESGCYQLSGPNPNSENLLNFWPDNTYAPAPCVGASKTRNIGRCGPSAYIYKDFTVSLFVSLSLYLLSGHHKEDVIHFFLHYSKFEMWSNKGEDLMRRISRLEGRFDTSYISPNTYSLCSTYPSLFILFLSLRGFSLITF